MIYDVIWTTIYLFMHSNIHWKIIIRGDDFAAVSCYTYLEEVKDVNIDVFLNKGTK